MRTSQYGPSALVRNRLGRGPTSGAWNVFINIRRIMVKVPAVDRGGYRVRSGRLEQGRFAGDSRPGSAAPLSQFRRVALLDGIDVLAVCRRHYGPWGEDRGT